ncbi:hypothetical protein EOL96_03850 [Candidatus Saccharibacteria bacterium]|nr:hypothetical protein [Candidatus Saccharibacteria bacterium]
MVSIKSTTHINEIGIRKINEDCVVVDETNKIYGVFDGASSIVPYISADGKTGGYIAASIAVSTFMNSALSLKATALKANERIEKIQTDADIDLSKSSNRFGTMAAVVKINKNKASLLQIGDSIAIVIDIEGNATVPLGYFDHDINEMRKWRQFTDQGVQNIRELIWDDIVRTREAANVSYGMLNGDKKLESHIRTITISLDNVATILLLTDGMFLPKTDPDANDNWNDYADCYLKSGLTGLFKLVRDTEDSDPALVKYPRFKLHDDSSAVAIDFIH